MFNKILPAVALLAAFAVPATAAQAADEPYLITIKDHKFEPARLEVPAGKKIRLKVKNLDSTVEEFESYTLNVEKLVPGGAEVTVYVRPLKPGEYKFFGEFHQKTAQGVVVAK
ncbi:MAG: cupredoxin domain-containing protein [Acidiferrobacteraceae bacterium]|jgi:plastocyanin